MLYTKFKGHGFAGFREEDFDGYIICGHGGHLGHVSRTV